MHPGFVRLILICMKTCVHQRVRSQGSECCKRTSQRTRSAAQAQHNPGACCFHDWPDEPCAVVSPVVQLFCKPSAMFLQVGDRGLVKGFRRQHHRHCCILATCRHSRERVHSRQTKTCCHPYILQHQVTLPDIRNTGFYTHMPSTEAGESVPIQAKIWNMCERLMP